MSPQAGLLASPGPQTTPPHTWAGEGAPETTCLTDKKTQVSSQKTELKTSS